jgi:carbonic anhydrase
MSEAIDQMLAANARYADTFDKGDLTAAPRKRVAIVSCMDARIRVHALLGIEEGDAHVIRNAGGVVTDDTIRSLAISQRLLGSTTVMVIQHTSCGMKDLDEDSFRATLREDTGEDPGWEIGGFHDLEDSVRHSVERLRTTPYLINRDVIRGFVYDVETGRLREVS